MIQNHSSMKEHSYTWPSTVTTGSVMICSVQLHINTSGKARLVCHTMSSRSDNLWPCLICKTMLAPTIWMLAPTCWMAWAGSVSAAHLAVPSMCIVSSSVTMSSTSAMIAPKVFWVVSANSPSYTPGKISATIFFIIIIINIIII